MRTRLPHAGSRGKPERSMFVTVTLGRVPTLDARAYRPACAGGASSRPSFRSVLQGRSSGPFLKAILQGHGPRSAHKHTPAHAQMGTIMRTLASAPIALVMLAGVVAP